MNLLEDQPMLLSLDYTLEFLDSQDDCFDQDDEPIACDFAILLEDPAW